LQDIRRIWYFLAKLLVEKISRVTGFTPDTIAGIILVPSFLFLPVSDTQLHEGSWAKNRIFKNIFYLRLARFQNNSIFFGGLQKIWRTFIVKNNFHRHSHAGNIEGRRTIALYLTDSVIPATNQYLKTFIKRTFVSECIHGNPQIRRNPPDNNFSTEKGQRK
jgi:hypothetical protein